MITGANVPKQWSSGGTVLMESAYRLNCPHGALPSVQGSARPDRHTHVTSFRTQVIKINYSLNRYMTEARVRLKLSQFWLSLQARHSIYNFIELKAFQSLPFQLYLKKPHSTLRVGFHNLMPVSCDCFFSESFTHLETIISLLQQMAKFCFGALFSTQSYKHHDINLA